MVTKLRTEKLKEISSLIKEADDNSATRNRPRGRVFLANGDKDLDCEDFSTRDSAQALYDSDTTDPHNLDADSDGIACEVWNYSVLSSTKAPKTSENIPAPEIRKILERSVSIQDNQRSEAVASIFKEMERRTAENKRRRKAYEYCSKPAQKISSPFRTCMEAMERKMDAGEGIVVLSPARISFVQEQLNLLGYNAGVPDGIPGKKTRKAIRDYKRDHNFSSSDNNPSIELWNRLKNTFDIDMY